MNQSLIDILDLVGEYQSISNSRNLHFKKAYILLSKSKISMGTFDLSSFYDYRSIKDKDPLTQFGLLLPPSLVESSKIFKKAIEYNLHLAEISREISSKLANFKI